MSIYQVEINDESLVALYAVIHGIKSKEAHTVVRIWLEIAWKDVQFNRAAYADWEPEWEMEPEWVVAVAKSESGYWYRFSRMPRIVNEKMKGWTSRGGITERATYASEVAKKIPWEQSLRVREIKDEKE